MRLILIILAIYFAVRLLGRLLSPIMNKQNSSAQGRSNRQDDNRKEGEVKIEFTDKNKKRRDDKDSGEGDYVDFEELD